ncbi:MAG: P-II family nitrogen regulator [Candidatus Nitrosopolaris sp.]
MTMRKIDVIVPHERLIEINEVIHKHKLGGMTFYNIKGRGRSKLEPVDPSKGILRPTPEFQTRIKCEMIVPEHMVRPIVDWH